MNSIDLSPFYRSSIGYDRLGSLIDSALRGNEHSTGYPPYDIEMLDENHYAIRVAAAGFANDELDINVENNVLTIRGQKAKDENERKYLHQGIANRTFERKFNLAEHVDVTGADLDKGLLTVNLVREIPEAMKPRKIPVNQSDSMIEHMDKAKAQAKGSQAA